VCVCVCVCVCGLLGEYGRWVFHKREGEDFDFVPPNLKKRTLNDLD
jgi:hypothetical protein